MPFNFTTSTGGGDDDVSSMTIGGYTNTIKVNGVTVGTESLNAVALNLDNPSCLGTIGGSGSFAIIY